MTVQHDAQPEGVPTRRRFLRQAALGGLALTFGPGLASGYPGDEPPTPELVLRELMPLNLESPFAALDGFLTPTSRFYVRSHFAQPTIDMTTWRLRIDGAVKEALTLDLNAIRKMPSKTFPATLECAGNGRAHLVPRANGVAWDLGAVSTAEWTGVPLADILEKAGVSDKAVEVVLSGADSGTMPAGSPVPGAIHYERSLPLEKARRPEVLLAYSMNGKDLPAGNGFPLRAVVSGWYGMASVKWLSRITVVESPFRGNFQTFDYTYWRRDGDRLVVEPLTTLAVKSQIARPTLHEVIRAGSDYRIYGAAWTGEADVTKVEVSTDGGKTWQTAKLLGEKVPFAWRLWELPWKAPKQPGRYRLMSRATDSKGQTQPEKHNRDSRAYRIHHTLAVEVTVV